MPKLHIGLVETCPPNSRGSMKRYADLIEKSLARSTTCQVSRFSLTEHVLPAQINRLFGNFRKLSTLAHHATILINARKLRCEDGIDVFHVVDGSHGYAIPLCKPVPTVVTIHDVIPLLQCKNKFPVPAPGLIARYIIDKAFEGSQDADIAICVSGCTKNDFSTNRTVGRTEQQLVTIFPPLDASFAIAPLSDEKEESSISEPYILHIGNNGFYKNREGVVRIFKELSTRVPHCLIMAGPPPGPSLAAMIDSLGIVERVKFVNDPSDHALKALYRNATLFLFPSIYEGFGWPPIEAMASGCPVVCSNAGSLDEVVGDAAIKLGCDDISGFSNACIQLIEDFALRERMRNLGSARAQLFCLEKFGDLLTATYLKAAGKTC